MRNLNERKIASPVPMTDNMPLLPFCFHWRESQPSNTLLSWILITNSIPPLGCSITIFLAFFSILFLVQHSFLCLQRDILQHCCFGSSQFVLPACPPILSCPHPSEGSGLRHSPPGKPNQARSSTWSSHSFPPQPPCSNSLVSCSLFSRY